MIPIKALPNYDPNNEQQFRDSVRQADDQNVKKGTDILLKGGRTGTRNPRLIVYSDDGTPWVLGVSNGGATIWTPL